MAMAKGIPDKKRRAAACKMETLEDAVEYLLEEFDLGGTNAYLSTGGKFTLIQLVGCLEEHDELKNKTQRRQHDILRNVLNEMMSIIRVGSTRKARYAFDSQGTGLEAREMLNRVLRALLLNGGDVKWTDLQGLVKISEEDGMTHLEFNSSVNYLVDNGVVEKIGKRDYREDIEKGIGKLIPDSRRVVCTAKAWGWEAGSINDKPSPNMDLFTPDGREVGPQLGFDTKDSGVLKISGSTKKTLTITLTEMTTELLDELSQILATLPDTDKRKPAYINRSTIVEVALWTLRRQIEYLEGQDGEPQSSQELAQLLVERLNEQ